ncbi:hypothetical protein ACNOYE_14260 [Nannocystaceae bacterium ST9]
MDEERVLEVICEINAFLQRHPWLDFEIMEYRGCKLIVMGSLDTSADHDIEIEFSDVAFVCTPMTWQTDTSRPPLALVQGDEACRLNERFRVESGHHIFQFVPEDYPVDFGCIIGARRIGHTIK